MKQELKQMLNPNETVLYEGKPNKKCFIFETIFNPLLPIAIVWGCIDFGLLAGEVFSGINDGDFFMFPFMLLHLFPVWLYLARVIFSVKRYNNTEYVITNMAIYVSDGVFSRNITTKSFADMSNISLHRGIFDRIFNVGDVIATTGQTDKNGNDISVSLDSISDYTQIYHLVKKLQMDVYSDVMYPNAKRPDDNTGYNTKFKP
ncbi:MAG: PH domain-containing protein [Acutalibacteraceae bacterium]